MTRAILRAFFVGLVAIATLGCGDSEDIDYGAPSGQQGNAGNQVQTGSVTFRFAQAQGVITVPSTTDSLFFTFFDGDVDIYDYQADYATVVTVPNVPVTADFVIVTALDDNGFPIAQVEGPVTVAQNGTTEFSASNMTATQVTLTSITPISTGVTVAQGGTQSNVFNNAFRLNYSNGQQFTLTGAQVQSLVADGATLTSSSPSTFTIDQNGNIVGVAPGTGTANFVYGGQTGSIPVTVTAPSTTTVSVNPTSLTLAPGAQSAPLQFSESTDGGQPTAISSGEFDFLSSNPAVATIDDAGVITVSDAATPGQTTTITGTRDGEEVTTTVTVGEAGTTFTSLTTNLSDYQLPAGATSEPVELRGVYANGSSIALDNTNVTFESSDESVATVDPDGSIVIDDAATNGETATITATAGGQTEEFNVTVGAVETSGISVTPSTFVVDQGDTTNFTVSQLNSDGTSTDITNSEGVTFANDDNATNVTFEDGVASGASAGSGTGTVTFDDNGNDFVTNYNYTVR